MFLPTTIKEVRERGWDQLDVILFSGDAYIDHPAFGAAVVGRLLEAEGYRVAIVPQPNWRDDLRDFTKLGVPRLFFGVSGGAMDSMVNHYTANLRLRHDDAYTPGGKAGFRPDHAVTVYSQILKRLYPHVPVVVGGIEASLRRLTHYDYWSDALKPSVLADSGADLLIYGMGERVVQEVARAMRNGYNAKLLRKIRQVAFLSDESYVSRLDPATTIRLNSYEECVRDKAAFGENFTVIETQSNLMNPEATLVEAVGGRCVVVTPANATLSTEELDHSFDLPYERAPHPRYAGKGDIPAWEMIKHSVNIHRGCFGGCSFCTISAHQGKFINSRSERSILAEVEKITKMPGFKGYLSDVGAPSANMYRMGGRDRELCGKCRRASCLHPKPCPNLDNDHRPLLALYEKIRAVKGVKKAFIGSGIRYDLFDRSPYLETVLKYHTSGRLKVAPEHTEENVLKLMRKPPFALFEQLNADFHRICSREKLPYQLIPYFISSHPGCTEREMKALSEKVLGKL
ncbi:MAG: YgiQ family radical SAM protein, partial [Alistipes senegalensis]|nr:YgiQ family radical SAM protein [Alistipes senegalensis]